MIAHRTLIIRAVTSLIYAKHLLNTFILYSIFNEWIACYNSDLTASRECIFEIMLDLRCGEGALSDILWMYQSVKF